MSTKELKKHYLNNVSIDDPRHRFNPHSTESGKPISRFAPMRDDTARKWRRILARSGQRKAQMRTIVFGIAEPTPASAEDILALGQVLNSQEPGSLEYLLNNLHLSGFRLFSRSTDTRDFLAAVGRFDKPYAQAVSQTLGQATIAITPSNLSSILTTIPREVVDKVTGIKKSIVFGYDDLFEIYFKRLAAGDKALAKNPIFSEIVSLITDACLGCANSFQDLAQVKYKKTLKLLDDVFSAKYTWPPLLAQAVDTNIEVAKGQTIAFDKDLTCVDTYAPEVARYQITALALQNISSQEDTPWHSTKAKVLLQDYILSSQYNGLSWLFSSAVPQAKNLSDLELNEAWQTPKTATYAHRFYSALRMIPKNPVFHTLENWSGFRSAFGGTLASWYANYHKRLIELRAATLEPIHYVAPVWMETPDVQATIRHLGYDWPTVKRTIEILNETQDVAIQALDDLSGQSGRLPTKETIENYLRWVATSTKIAAFITSLQNILIANTSPQDETEGKNPGYDWGSLAKIEVADSLNRAYIPPSNPSSELNELATKLSTILSDMDSYVKRIETAAEEPLNPISGFYQRNKDREGLAKMSDDQIYELSVRKFVDFIFKFFRHSSQPVKLRFRDWALKTGLLAGVKPKAMLNKYLFLGQGFYYKSPKSRSRHQPYPITVSFFKSRNPQGFLAELIDQFSDLKSEGGDQSRWYLDLCGMRFQLLASGLTKSIPTQAGRVDCILTPEETLNHQSLIEAWKNPAVSPDNVVRAISIYRARLKTAARLVFRNGFIQNVRASWDGLTDLIYLPKNTEWKVPTRYASTFPSIFKDNPEPTFNPVDFMSNLSRYDAETRKFMVQLPHTWKAAIPVSIQPTQLSGAASVAKAGVTVLNKTKTPLFTLLGTNSLINQLDSLLLEDEQLELSAIAIQFTLMFSQSTTYTETGGWKLTLSPAKPKWTLHVPINYNDRSPAQPFPLKNVVAIDIGEHGLGYAAFPLDNPAGDRLLAKGFVPIPTIRAFIRKCRGWRKSLKTYTSYSRTFDPGVLTARESVAGRCLIEIQRLMARYSAFPVMERELGSFDVQDPDLSKLYLTIVSKLLFNGSAAPDSVRTHWWGGSAGWTLENWERKAEADTYKPLKVFPGAGVAAAGSSRTCSVCRRNVFQDLKQLKDGQPIPVYNGGIIKLANGDYTLENYKGQTVTITQAKAIANTQYRFGTGKTGASTVSHFKCRYADCETRIGADVNAAINLARRFLGSVRKISP